MSSKRVLRKNACTGKVRYKTHADALDALIDMRKNGKDTRMMGTYTCPFRPRHVHVGHRVRADRAKL